MKSDSRPGLMVLLAILAAGTVWPGVNEWTNAGPESGGAGFLAFDPRDPATVYAGTSVGVFKSKDGGASWSNAGLIGWAVASLVIDPQNPGALYAVTGYAGDDFGANRVFKSADGGATWNEADSGLPTQGPCCVQLLAIAPQNTATLYALAGGDRRELFKSTDGGVSWAPTSGLPGRLYFLAVAIDPQNSSTLYAAANGAEGTGRAVVAVFKSRDGGASWNKADSGLPGAHGIGMIQVVPFEGLAIDPKNPSTVYATMSGIGVYKSTDGGASWRAANSGLPNLVGDYEFMSCCISGVIIDPQTPNTLYALGSFYNVIFKSTNGGVSWKAASTLGATVGGSLTMDPHTGSLYKGPAYAPGLFLKSADGGATWSNAYFVLRASPVSSLAIDPQSSGTVYAGARASASGRSSASKSTDAGMSWFDASSGMGPGFPVVALAIDPQTPSTVYAGATENKVDDNGDPVPCGFSSASGIFKSVDGGMNWVDTRVGTGCVSAIVIDPQNPSTVYAGSWYNGVYKSTDGGTSWSAVNAGLPSGPGGVYVSALAVDPKNPGALYAGTGGGVFKSTDGGASWSNAGLTPGSYALAIDPQNTSTVYAATSGGLFKSTDGGASWRNLFPSSPTNIYAVAINPRNPSTIYAGADNGVAQSTDGGESWTSIPGGPGRIRLLALDPQDPNTVYSGGPGGLFAISLDQAALGAEPAR